MIVFQRSDLEALATTLATKFETRSLLIVPSDPVYSTRISSKRLKTRKRSIDGQSCRSYSDDQRRMKGLRPETMSPPPSSPSCQSLSSSSSSSNFSFNFLSSSPPIGILGHTLSPPLSSASPSPTSLMKNPFNLDCMDGINSSAYQSSPPRYQHPYKQFQSPSSSFIPIKSQQMIS